MFLLFICFFLINFFNIFNLPRFTWSLIQLTPAIFKFFFFFSGTKISYLKSTNVILTLQTSKYHKKNCLPTKKSSSSRILIDPYHLLQRTRKCKFFCLLFLQFVDFEIKLLDYVIDLQSHPDRCRCHLIITFLLTAILLHCPYTPLPCAILARNHLYPSTVI